MVMFFKIRLVSPSAKASDFSHHQPIEVGRPCGLGRSQMAVRGFTARTPGKRDDMAVDIGSF